MSEVRVVDEVRALALQAAIDYINGDTRRGQHYGSDEVLKVADKFEDWLARKLEPAPPPKT